MDPITGLILSTMTGAAILLMGIVVGLLFRKD